jgi:hypothetical protein
VNTNKEPANLSQMTRRPLYVRTLLDMNRQWTHARLSSEIGIVSSTIHRISAQSLKMQNIGAQSVLHNPTKVHMWQCSH